MFITNGRGRISTKSTTLNGLGFKMSQFKLMEISDWGVALEVRNEGSGGSIGSRKKWPYRFDAQPYRG
jgi:hypothetical protein